MKNILCYGDSNTWGSNPANGERFPRDVRWPGVLQQLLGDDYWVIEEGLCGRTTVWDDPIEEHKNGKTYLHPCLATHDPLDLVVLMLGTNDTKTRFSVTAYDIANSAGVLVDIIQRSWAGHGFNSPHVLLVCPPPMGTLGPDLAPMFVGANAKAAGFPRQFERVAREVGCAYLPTDDLPIADSADGLHLTAEAHRRLAAAVAPRVVQMLS